MVKVTSPSDRTARSRVCRAVADGARRHAHVTCCQASISRGRGELGHHRHDVMGTQGAGLTCANLGLKDCLPPALLLCNGKTTGPSQMKTVLVDRHIHDKLVRLEACTRAIQFRTSRFCSCSKSCCSSADNVWAAVNATNARKARAELDILAMSPEKNN